MERGMKRTIGLCAGASTITAVELRVNGSQPEVVRTHSHPHEGNPKKVIHDLWQSINISHDDSVAITGRRFKEFLNLSNIPEPLAVEYALQHVNGKGVPYDAVISAGGETFIVYTLDDNGRISRVHTGNKCASGTGEFFIQQTRRMDVSLEDATEFSRNEIPHHVSGRCSVFCKSDCTHATNKGIPKGQVVAGLSQMMGQKVLELLKNTPKRNIMIVGGTTRITVMIDYLKKEIQHLCVPEEAVYFEALGCALWALKNKTQPVPQLSALFTEKATQFDYHKPLRDFENMVTFTEMERGTAQPGDRCILGLDVGSTTTKAVLLREEDNHIIASEYLRTNGDPVGASRKCYRVLLDQLNGTDIIIRGLGVTGSGRKIAGLHALTNGIINEIIAHAEAAIFFDADVDTIFEIGGQDAKYTFITNGVASDYAMNEACSAGTGSFLEESARETLGIDMEDIADWAMKGNRPPNFNDQCAAFISSDIKNTSHEGIPKEDIVAGLVYSICMNYVNRVKGARPVGGKVFMQGGVCYNRAVPIAMAALSGKEIIVPPEPGLMGAFGVALEVKNRLEQGLMEEDSFDLDRLINRNVEYKKAFTCAGGKEKCDLGCTVNRIVIEEKTYPFGGACNRYYNLRQKVKVSTADHDYVKQRYDLVYNAFSPDLNTLPEGAPTVGLSRSLLMNTYYPVFANFFAELGFRPILAENVDEKGIDQCSAAFCYPCEIAHGYFRNLLDKKPDFIFLPHILGVQTEKNGLPSKTCPLVQGEPYYLRSTFLNGTNSEPVTVMPVIDFNSDHATQKKQFAAMADQLGVSRRRAGQAFVKARQVQDNLQEAMLALGRKALQELERDPDRTGVVLFGRPYNAFVPEANKGIPNKFASRGYTIIPFDCLDLKPWPAKEHMFWSIGQLNLQGAELVKAHPQLFGTFITNFSCGPDSFVVGYFRDIMETKPSLTLELDNHTADAGLETRIEAFLDIVARYRNLQSVKPVSSEKGNSQFLPATSLLKNGNYSITTSDGEKLTFHDPRVKLVLSSMSQWVTQAMTAAFRTKGVRTVALPAMNEEDLKMGRGNTTCKECLPLQLTTGSLLKYLRDEKEKDEVTVYFMPTADGPCRLGQYKDFMRDYVRNHRIPDVTFFSMSSGDGYGGLGTSFSLLVWKALVISDIFEDIHNNMLVLSEDVDSARKQLMDIWQSILTNLEHSPDDMDDVLERAVSELKTIPQKQSLKKTPQILMVGEIYVRKEGISRRWLPEWLAEQGIISHVAPIHEWGHYVDWLYDKKLLTDHGNIKQRVIQKIKWKVKKRTERKLKALLGRSGWYVPRIIDIDHVVAAGEHYISRQLCGEAILTVGGPLAEVGKEFCGAIAIGPFGCMPNRLGESILNLNMDREHVTQVRPDAHTDLVTQQIPNLPFLAIESDGSPFPQVIEARLETFVIQALRLHEVMQKI